MNKYPALKIIVAWLRFLGWFECIVGSFLVLLVLINGMQSNPLYGFAAAAVAAFIVAFSVVMLFAAAEFLMVQVDIEKGIRNLKDGPSEPSREQVAKYESIINSEDLKFTTLASGTFAMGEGSNTQQVTLTEPFELAVYPVTQEQYQMVMGSNPSKFKGPRNPVEQVTWDEAVEFCQRLSELPAEKSEGYTYRLPTEAEWEYACRAGTTTEYSFGDGDGLLRDYAWYKDNSTKMTRSVGQKRPNQWGLYDMHGNVWEWCQDWHGDYPSGSVTDPTGAASGSSRVIRGGSWDRSSDICRSALRYRIAPDIRGFNLGFRVLRSSIK